MTIFSVIGNFQRANWKTIHLNLFLESDVVFLDCLCCKNIENGYYSLQTLLLYLGQNYLKESFSWIRMWYFLNPHVKKKHIGGCPRGVMVKVMDCGIVVSEFILQSRYYVHFRANTLGKGINPLILPAMG